MKYWNKIMIFSLCANKFLCNILHDQLVFVDDSYIIRHMLIVFPYNSNSIFQDQTNSLSRFNISNDNVR